MARLSSEGEPNAFYPVSIDTFPGPPLEVEGLCKTKAFLERLYPLRHHYGHMIGKPAGAIITYCIPTDKEMFPPASQSGVDAIKYFLMEEGMVFVGDVSILGNIPCVRCKDADTCKTSGIKMLHGPEATASCVKIGTFEDQPEIVEATVKLDKDIAEKLKLKQ